MKASHTLRVRLFSASLATACLLVLCPATQAKVPYDIEKFRSVLDASKLQAPTSSPAKIEQGDFAGQSNEYFFLDDTKTRLTFTVSGDSNRSELRQLSGDWDTATPIAQRLIGRVKIHRPGTSSLRQFTFMQIHDKKIGDQGLNKPLIRLAWRKSRSNNKDHLWAAIRTPKDPDKPIALKNLGSEWVDLGPRPEGFFDVEIRVQNSQMNVILGGQSVVTKDVSYWNGLKNYFKAGVYNQNAGTSKVEFDVLRYAPSDAPAAPPAAPPTEPIGEPE